MNMVKIFSIGLFAVLLSCGKQLEEIKLAEKETPVLNAHEYLDSVAKAEKDSTANINYGYYHEEDDRRESHYICLDEDCSKKNLLFYISKCASLYCD